jgi:hypothetical protein
MSAGEIPRGIIQGPKGKPELPEERFADAEEVRQLCRNMIWYDRDFRAPARARIDGLFAGNPTFSLQKLKQKGFGWLPRVNYREGEADLAALQTPLYDLVSEVDHQIEVTLDIDNVTQTELDAYENAIQQHFTWLNFTRSRTDFNFNMLVSQREMLLHGLGYNVRLNDNWMGRVPISGRILFPETCPLNFKRDGKYFLLREFVPGEDVYGYIRNEKAARADGWLPDNLWQALVLSTKPDRYPQNTDLQEIQRNMRRGDIGWSSSTQAGLWLNHLITAEYEGGFSHYIVEENVSVNAEKDAKGYLYRNRYKFDSWPLTIYNFDIGDGGFIHSVRGLGMRSKDFYELSNRLKNAMAAQVLIGAFPMVKLNGQTVDQDKLRLWRMGALSLIPQGVEPTMIQFPPLAQGPLALDKSLRETLERNSKSSTPTTPEAKDRETAYSFSMRAQDAARISNGMQSLYESNLQQDYDMQLRMVVKTPKGPRDYQKMAQEFRDRCEKTPRLDKKVWADIWRRPGAIAEVRENTSTGAGSAATRLNALLALMQYIYPNTDEGRKITIERDLVSTLMGGSKVDRYARNPADIELPDSDDSLAAVESDALVLGGDAVVSSKQNHVKHSKAHLGKALEIVQAVQNGEMPPEQALAAIRKLGQHTADHLQQIQNNPMRKAEFDELYQEWQALGKISKKLESQIQAQSRQQERGQQMSEQSQIKDKVAQSDIARKDRKADADIVRQFRKDAVKNRLADASTAAKISRQGTNGNRQPASAA